MLSQQSLEIIGRACHEANVAICSHNDEEFYHWDDAPEWQREAAIDGVKTVLGDPSTTPEDLHKAWMDKKLKDGWTYGKIKDDQKKTHPCLVDYDELDEYQQLKDSVFNAIVKSFITKRNDNE